MQVRAIETGYFNSKRRDPGEEFAIEHRSQFSRKWMEPIGWDPTVDPLDHDADGKKGGTKKAPAAERIKLASELSGRTDIKTAKEADEIIAAAGGDDADDSAPGDADDGTADADDETV